jgi:hypothetical protein
MDTNVSTLHKKILFINKTTFYYIIFKLKSS